MDRNIDKKLGLKMKNVNQALIVSHSNFLIVILIYSWNFLSLSH